MTQYNIYSQMETSLKMEGVYDIDEYGFSRLGVAEWGLETIVVSGL